MEEVEIPSFKLAKVGQDRRRRNGAGLPWFFGGGGSMSGVGGASLSLGAKMGILMLVSSLGVGSYNVGLRFRPQLQKMTGTKTRPSFAGKFQYAGDTSNVPMDNKANPDSLGMVSDGAGGGNGKPTAADAASGANANAAADQATPPSQAPGAPAPAGMDLASLAAAAKKKANVLGDNPLGGLGQGVGNGAGMGGGNSGAYSAQSSLGSNATGSKGSAANLGQKGTTGILSAFQRALGGGGLSQARSAGVQGLGALGQARSVLGDQVGAQNSYSAGRTYDQGAASGGSPISGTGDSPGAAAVPAASADQTAQGPAGGEPTQAGDNNPYNDVAPATQAGSNSTPWQSILNYASMALIAAGGLLLLASILSYIINSTSLLSDGLSEFLDGVISWLTIAATGLAAIATAMGLMIFGMGQQLQGGLITTLGAITTAVAGMVSFDPGAFASGDSEASAAEVLSQSTVAMVLSAGSGLVDVGAGALM